MKMLFLLACLSVTNVCFAQAQTAEVLPYVNKYFCIIASTKKYNDALVVAKNAQKQLQLKLDLRGLKPYKLIGLTQSKASCIEDGWDYPAYVGRGRYDDGNYISIEYSDIFNGFAKGYYIVVAACGDKTMVFNTLAKAKPLYKTAYVKQTEIYMGCMH